MAGEHFRQTDLIVVTLPHLLPVDGDHIIMQPVTGRNMLVADGTLRYLTFMMRELKIHSSAVNIKLLAQVLGAHRRTFDMPAGKAFAPGTLPAHDVFGRSKFPQGKVLAIAFFVLSVQVTGGLEQVVQNPAT